MFDKQAYIDKQIAAINRIEQFKRELGLDDDSMPSIISLLEDMGVEIDACSNCGAMPMMPNCNNANCS